jgi:hypothetical protein
MKNYRLYAQNMCSCAGAKAFRNIQAVIFWGYETVHSVRDYYHFGGISYPSLSDAIYSSRFVASNGRMVANNEFKKMWKEVVVA